MSQKPSHTPGPWTARYNPATRNTAIESSPGTGNIGIVHGGLDEDCASDARLIAAAPDMLDALLSAESILWMAEHYAEAGGRNGPEMLDYTRAADDIRAAIAKARGDR